MSVKTLDKLQILRTLRGNNDVWIGLDDLTNEGEFVWKEDGSIMTSDEKNLLFPPTEPSGNAIRDEDCVHIKSTSLLNDNLCNRGMPWVCEIQ